MHLRHAVRRLLAQLTQHDRRRLAEIANRTELEVEEDRDRDGDGDRQARREPQAAVAHQLPDNGGADASADWQAGAGGLHRLKLTRGIG